MAQVTKFEENNFCWLDYAADDTKKAVDFFSRIFGWEYEWVEGSPINYVMLNLKGMPLTGAMDLTKEMRDMNVPPCWTSYVGVNDIKECLKKVVENGGKVMCDACDVGNYGAWGLFEDSEGGVLGLWQPKELMGYSFKEEPGAVAWFEFASNVPEKTSEFYSKVFGWEVKKENMGGMEYYTFSLNGKSVAGMYKMPEMMKGVPPHWLPYFVVENLDEKIEFLTKENGQVLMPKTFVEGIGYFGVYKDPQGGAVGLLEN